MNLGASTGDDRRLWKIVNLSDFRDVEGEIISADEDTGKCTVKVGEETKEFDFGPGGMRIVGRSRR